MSEAVHIAIYGAVADISPQLGRPLPWLAGFKRSLKLQRDLRRYRRGRFHCDYRDYGVAYASNIGDIAIAETIRRMLRQSRPDCVFSNVDWGDVERLRAIHAQRNIDLLIVAGGGYFLFDHAGRLPARLRDDAEFLGATQTPYVLWGVGVNQPFNPQGQCALEPSAADATILRALLDGARLIAVRDEYSADFLGAHTRQTVPLVGDPALHAAEALGLAAPRLESDPAPLVGLNFPFHGPSSNRFLVANLPAYARALIALQRLSNCRFRYIAHHACEYAVPHLLRTAGLRLDIVHADLQATCGAYRDLDLHIGGMLHSCILAASSGTPWIAIAYDIKHRGFNRLMGMEDYYQDTLAFSESALTSLAMQALSRSAELREKINARRAELRGRIAEFAAAALPDPIR